ncbi:hypothetical protein H696_04649 [Fonticula alba]|uniref:INO80 complex subunit F domain-containing protein n=1 Tax=Fonticula alba TaxID=691883 RepID=A0A058Z6R9_FONAL|nr:hypothetical protein H696_04649 [Fonticula alba]KCV69232.1 hypothetical protein H696_04649 [Fonticula alba]|eukprot:XP_009496803.1 hypothetical protein H696_04649 [Fonticula alba]
MPSTATSPPDPSPSLAAEAATPPPDTAETKATPADRSARLEELKKRTREIEKENDALIVKLARANKDISRLRLERGLLFDRLEELEKKGVIPFIVAPAHASTDVVDDLASGLVGTPSRHVRSEKSNPSIDAGATEAGSASSSKG